MSSLRDEYPKKFSKKIEKELVKHHATKSTNINYEFNFVVSLISRPIIPISHNPGILDIHPLELARQLSIIFESKLKKISSRELLAASEDMEKNSPNLTDIIDMTNFVLYNFTI